ncbi:MAG: hypothetical protein P1R58_10235 [bacterium]|nr:hypothetical protein [bacterium]
MPIEYDGKVLTFSFTIDESSIGKSFAVDSAWYPTNSSWLFSTTGGTSVPSWDGPHAYTIVPCCVGPHGNADNSMADMPLDVSDLNSIINWMFVDGPAPLCPGEANVNGDMSGSIDIADVSYMVDYFWLGGPAPPACP